jgi:hypothetical protein
LRKQIRRGMNLLSIPPECIDLIVDKMDPYSKGCFSLTNKDMMMRFYSAQVSEFQKSLRRERARALGECHRLIRNIYDNNVLSGWCEICGRETILRTAVSSMEYPGEPAQWVCIDRCKMECGLCQEICTINRAHKGFGLCERCMPELFPWLC